jgi:hypothetical protein
MSAQDELQAALAAERRAMEALLAGAGAAGELVEARDRYLASYDAAGPPAWGRLIGALKMAILAGADVEPIARRALAEAGAAASAPAGYVRSLAAVAIGEEPDPAAIQAMVAAGGAFERTGRALDALGAGDGERYRAAIADVLADFEAREQFLGAAVADTVMVVERLADARGIAARPESPLLPAP